MFMRYCGGGPGHACIPTCSIAWQLAPTIVNATIQASETVMLPQADAESSSSEDNNGSDYEPDLDELELLEGTAISETLDYGL